MPTYQYACTACDHRFDAVQSFSDASLTECPECAGKLRKLYGSVGVVFKGSGFYRTDSRSESKAAATADKSSSSDKPSSDKSADKSSSDKSSTSTTTSSDKSSSAPSTSSSSATKVAS
ncbi:FmdB family zinc ribbon protein [Actinophytocola glycyrrhizae]|uniref:FmdB family zinc ribbon protein n=1 Tax=Actinophytocola glycyrrhizae TaxID=2044873 RepID=A0ABV9RZL4_9PSEU